MSDEEIKHIIQRYNEQQESLNYWIAFGLAATAELRKHGMKYADIHRLGSEGALTSSSECTR